MSGEVGVPDQDVLEQELEELLQYAARALFVAARRAIDAPTPNPQPGAVRPSPPSLVNG